jgi:hypothetical protein
MRFLFRQQHIHEQFLKLVVQDITNLGKFIAHKSKINMIQTF